MGLGLTEGRVRSTISPRVSLERVDAEQRTRSGSAHPLATSSEHSFAAAVRPQDVSGLS